MTNAGGHSILFKAVRRLLRPIARFCIQRSLKFQEFEEAAKLSFIDIATEEMLGQGLEVNTSRISVVTGLQRREVTRLSGSDPLVKEERSLLFKILGSWEQDRKYRTKSGKPRILTVEGKESEFIELVTAVSKDLNPYTVLFELERVGAVERVSQGIKLAERVYVPSEAQEGLSLLADDVEDLVGAVTENVLDQPASPNLHIATRYDNIVEESLPKIREWFLELGAKFHEDARRFLSRYDKDTNVKLKSKRGGAKVSLGSFSRIVKKKGK
jgi:hypothetical protein